MKTILIDCTLTGGRGPAKKTAEFIWECQRLKIPYKLITDNRLVGVLRDLGIKPDYIISVDYSLTNTEIYDLFEKRFRQISYDILVKFGARTVGPYVAKKQGKPYIIIDGGLPDKYEMYPSMYDSDTYKNARAYIVTSNFPWEPSPSCSIDNVQVGYFPISLRTKSFIEKIREKSKDDLIKQYQPLFTPFFKSAEITINLSMTNDYVDSKCRVTCGGWLKAQEYDQSVGFVRRLINDLGESGKRIEVILDSKVASVARDIVGQFKNISIVTWKDKWNYEAEIALEKIADFTISRAANYQPFSFALARGTSVTSAVPANGYMDEDNAAIQAQGMRLTENIIYDDEEYVKKLMKFVSDTKKQAIISNYQKTNFEKFGKENNSLVMLFDSINSL